MNRLLKREIALTIARPQSFFVQLPNAVVVRNLRVTFDIEKNLKQDPNTCEVKVYNLSEASRGELQVKPLHIRLDAGYDGKTERLFEGDLRFSQSKRQPTGWETTLQVGDGDRAHRYARINKSFASGVNVRDAIGEVAKSMGLKVPASIAEARELAAQFTSGLSLRGPSQAELAKLLRPHGFSHSIQDGRLQILRGSQAREVEAIVISQDTGLIGSPEFGTPDDKGGPPTLSLKTLLKPAVSPGGLIVVESQAISGTFRVERVTHSGDTHGPEWYTAVEAKEFA